MTELDILVEARRWLSVRTHWCKQALWRDAAGESIHTPVAFSGRDVASTCAIGATFYVALIGLGQKARQHPGPVHAITRLGAAGKTLGYQSIADLNDRGLYAEVLDAFDRAIAMAQEEIYGGLEEPSIPIQVPAPNQEPREIPVYPSTVDPGPIEAPVEAPAETPQYEPVPA